MKREDWEPERLGTVESVDAITGEVERRRLTLEEVITRAAKVGACSVEDIKGRRRLASISSARRDYCLRARAAGYSWTQIAAFIGRDHTSCMVLADGRRRKRQPLLLAGVSRGRP